MVCLMRSKYQILKWKLKNEKHDQKFKTAIK